MVLAASCSGTVDPENQDPGTMPEEFTEPFTLYADKTTVEANGKDVVTFSLKWSSSLPRRGAGRG